MALITLGPWDLSLAAGLILLLALMSWHLRLGIERQVLIAATRGVVQLTLLGLVLESLFKLRSLPGIGALALVMLTVAGWEVMSRQQRRYRGLWGMGIGTLSMFLSSFSVTLLALLLVIRVEPWYQPQYLIPLLGMLLGNTMNGIAIALDNLTRQAWEGRGRIEARLLLGADWGTAITDIRRDALRSGLIPILNAMAAAGLVSLPGMMTGQILAGSPPMEAAKYQILILFLISAGTGLGSVAAVRIGSRRLFDERQRLRLDRLRWAGSRNPSRYSQDKAPSTSAASKPARMPSPRLWIHCTPSKGVFHGYFSAALNSNRRCRREDTDRTEVADVRHDRPLRGIRGRGPRSNRALVSRTGRT